jgi:hypothetical protein
LTTTATTLVITLTMTLSDYWVDRGGVGD